MIMRSVKGSLASSVSESETYASVRSDLSDTQQPCQHSVSMNRSAAIVVPSPMHQRPLQLVGHSSYGLEYFLMFLLYYF